MNNNTKIVTELPLTNLWTDNGDFWAKRGKYLTTDDIQDQLRKYPVEFVVANIGAALKWIGRDQSFDFWKREVKTHLADDINNINLDTFIDNYAYIASEWTSESEISMILLEKYH